MNIYKKVLNIMQKRCMIRTFFSGSIKIILLQGRPRNYFDFIITSVLKDEKSMIE